MKLSHAVQGRDNNFNLVRLIAAFAVLLSHSFALVAGTGKVEPLRANLSMSLGMISVDVFFIASGFLVTASLLSRKSMLEFVRARILRIYPALTAMVLLSVFLLGLFFTSLPASSFLESRETQVFAFKNMTLISGVAYALPGVFNSTPWKDAVNGSLWTMPFEIRMYALLAIIWMIMNVFGGLRGKAVNFVLVLLAALSFLKHFANHFYFHSESDADRLFYMFFTGAAYFVLKDRITLSRSIFSFAIVALFIAALNKEVFFVSYNIVLAYVLFWIVYIPAGTIRNYNRIGDYSYGIYIYAFPIQQSIAALIPGVSVAVMISTSAVATFFFALLSWHLIEERALRLKDGLIKLPQPA